MDNNSQIICLNESQDDYILPQTEQITSNEYNNENHAMIQQEDILLVVQEQPQSADIQLLDLSAIELQESEPKNGNNEIIELQEQKVIQSNKVWKVVQPILSGKPTIMDGFNKMSKPPVILSTLKQADVKKPIESIHPTEIKAKVIGLQKPPFVPTLNLPVIVHTLDSQSNSSLLPSAELSQSQPLNLAQTQSDKDVQQLESTASSTIPSNRQWQKVTFNKKRSNTSSIQQNSDSTQKNATSIIASKPKNQINFTNLKNTSIPSSDLQPRTYREHLIQSPQMKPSTRQQDHHQSAKLELRRKISQPGETVPLFDCLFCCQEHFVLSKLSEKNLSHYMNSQECNILMVNMIMAGKIKIQKESQEQQVQVKTQLSKQLCNIVSSHKDMKFQTGILKHYTNLVKVQTNKSASSNGRPKIPLLSFAKLAEVPQINDFIQLADLSDSDILLDGSRVNLKTRRQRILETISFETECHNIYDPYFTSEDDQAQVSDAEELHAPTTRRVRVVQQTMSSDSLDSHYTSSSQSEEVEESFKSEEGLMVDNMNIRQIEEFQVDNLRDEENDKILIDENEEDQYIRACDHDEQSLSSIDKQIMDIDDDEMKFEYSDGEDHQDINARPIFTATNILNIQENKFTPDQDDKDSQRYTFGCITPKGVNLDDFLQSQKGPFTIASSPNDPLRIPNYLQHIEEIKEVFDPDTQGSLGAIQIADQSPISCFKNQKMIQELSTVDPIMRDNCENVQNNCLTENDAMISKINFYPPLAESLEGISQQNFTRFQNHRGGEDDASDLSLKITHQAISEMQGRRRVMINGGGDKDSCFSPIQQDIDDNSLSREGAFVAAIAAREGLFNGQGPCFSSVDYEDITMGNDQEGNQMHQHSSHMFGHQEIAMTSNFQGQIHLIRENSSSNERYSIDRGIDNNRSLEPQQTINLGYNQSQSFSAFHSKHVLTGGNNHQTPLIIHNIKRKQDTLQFANLLPQMTVDEQTCSANKLKKKGGPKKFMIKQEQLTQLLQKAIQKKISQTASNIQENTINSQDNIQINYAVSLFDSMIRQGTEVNGSTTMLQNMSQRQASSKSQLETVVPAVKKQSIPLPKHKKHQKTQDFGLLPSSCPQEISSSFKNMEVPNYTEVTMSDFRHQEPPKRAPKVPGIATTITQKTRKTQLGGNFTEPQTFTGNTVKTSYQRLPQNNEPNSRQAALSGTRQSNAAGLPKHLSFNNNNQINTKHLITQDQSERPLTLRDSQPYEEQNQPFLKNLIFPNTKQLLTKQELNDFLRSAICSSRYSTSSNIFQQQPTNTVALTAIKKSHHLQNSSLHQQSIERVQLQKTSSAKKRKTEALSSPKRIRRAPLLTEGYEHGHHLSIDRQTNSILPKSSAKLVERRDSCKVMIKQVPQSASQNIRIMGNKNQTRQLQHNMSGSLEKIKLPKHHEHLKVKKVIKAFEATGNSKERLKLQKKHVAKVSKQQLQQIELQNYLNLCNSINFSNDMSIMPSGKPSIGGAASTSMIFAKQQKGGNNSSILTNENFTTKNHQSGNNAVIMQPMQDTSNPNIMFLSNNNLLATSNTTAPCNQTSGGGGTQCEMSTTISNNQLSLTRIGGVRGLSTNNKTSSSGGQNNSNNMNQTIVVQKKVVVPLLQLNKLKTQSTTHKSKQLNGSQDEIQLQNLLQNLNFQLQATSNFALQTRGSALREGGNNSNNPMIINTLRSSQPQIINTRRSQASSLSAQRGAIVSATGQQLKRKDSIDAGNNIPIGPSNMHLKQLNQTVQSLNKKQESLPQSKERRKKSNKVLKNSFTLKHLKLMMNNVASVQPQQFTARQQQETERTISSNRQQDLKHNTNAECQQRNLTKLLIKNQKHILANTRAVVTNQDTQHNSILNRSSLNPISKVEKTTPNGGGQSTKNKPLNNLKKQEQLQQSNSTVNLNQKELTRFYDTGKQQIASPIKNQIMIGQSSMNKLSNTSAPAKQQNVGFTLKSVFTKQGPMMIQKQEGRLRESLQ